MNGKMTKGTRVFTEIENANKFAKRVRSVNGRAVINVHVYVCGGNKRDKYHVDYVCDLNKLRAV